MMTFQTWDIVSHLQQCVICVVYYETSSYVVLVHLYHSGPVFPQQINLPLI